MFTESDYIAYFTEIEMMERTMRDLYQAAALRVSDSEVKQLFLSLSEAEAGHAEIADGIRRLLLEKSVK